MIDNQTLDQKIDIPTDFLRIHSRTFSKVRRNSFLRVFSMKTSRLDKMGLSKLGKVYGLAFSIEGYSDAIPYVFAIDDIAVRFPKE